MSMRHYLMGANVMNPSQKTTTIFTCNSISMATPIRSLINIVHSPDRTSLVTSITSLLRHLNPQNPNPQIGTSIPLNQFTHHLDSKLVIKTIQKQTNPNHALHFFNWASNPNPNPNDYHHTQSCYVAITDVLLSHSLFSTAISLIKESNNLSDFFIGKFIKAYGDRGNTEAAINWFHQAKKIENGNCLFSYNSILGVLVKANRIKLAQTLFDEILQSNVVQPDVSTYTTMIRGFCKMGMIDNAKKVFDEMTVKPNMVTYNTMINGLCKKGDMENARLIFDRKDCSPDTVTYTTLIDGYCKSGELEEAKNCMSEMVKRGCKPNELTYNAMIYGLCMKGHVGKANLMVTKMRLDGLKDNVSTHTSILKGLCIAGKSEEAVRYLRNMIKSNMKLDVKSYAVIVNEFCKMGKSEEAISLLMEMQARGIKPDVWSFNVVFRILVENGEFDRAILLLKQMPKMGCSPNFVSYKTIICGLCMVKGKMHEVEKLVDDMIRSCHTIDSTMYSCLLKGYCEDGNEETAMRIAYEMMSKKICIDLESFSVLVKELCAERKVTEAEKFLEFCGRCPGVDVENYRRVLDEHMCVH